MADPPFEEPDVFRLNVGVYLDSECLPNVLVSSKCQSSPKVTGPSDWRKSDEHQSRTALEAL